MDLQVYAIILIVFLVSFMSYLFISKFLPHGKTFDEMIAEKKRMREELLGVSKNVSSGKQNNAGGKKKPRKDVKKVKLLNIFLCFLPADGMICFLAERRELQGCEGSYEQRVGRFGVIRSALGAINTPRDSHFA